MIASGLGLKTKNDGLMMSVHRSSGTKTLAITCVIHFYIAFGVGEHHTTCSPNIRPVTQFFLLRNLHKAEGNLMVRFVRLLGKAHCTKEHYLTHANEKCRLTGQHNSPCTRCERFQSILKNTCHQNVIGWCVQLQLYCC